jgi:hypothetical protein
VIGGCSQYPVGQRHMDEPVVSVSQTVPGWMPLAKLRAVTVNLRDVGCSPALPQQITHAAVTHGTEGVDNPCMHVALRHSLVGASCGLLMFGSVSHAGQS